MASQQIKDLIQMFKSLTLEDQKEVMNELHLKHDYPDRQVIKGMKCQGCRVDGQPCGMSATSHHHIDGTGYSHRCVHHMTGPNCEVLRSEEDTSNLCGKPTKKGTPCKNNKDKCPWHK
jgi:hypothetical protein